MQQQKQATQSWGQQIRGIFQDNWNAIKGIIVGAMATAFLSAALAVAGFVSDSLAEFQKFETGMAEVFTLLPGMSQDAMGQMKQDALEAGSAMGRIPGELLPAMSLALGSGIPEENIFEFMKTANEAAIGGVAQLTTSVDALTSVVNAYGPEVISAAEASDMMFMSVQIGKSTLDEIARSIYNVTPTAAALGVGFGDIAAAMAVMTAQGVPTSVTTTQLRQLLVELSKEGGAAAETFERLAGQSFAEFISQGGNLQGALAIMETGASAANVNVSNLFSSVEAGSAALSLTGKNTQAYTDALAAMEESAGATEAAASQFNDTIERAESIVEAQTSELKILIAEGLAPTKKAWLELKRELLDAAISFAKHSNAVREGQTARDLLVDQLKDAAAETDKLVSVNGGAVDSWDAVNLALLELAKTYPAQNGNLEDLEMNTRAVETMTRLLNEGFEGNARELAAAAIATMELEDEQRKLREATIAASGATDGWMAGLQSTTPAIEEQTTAAERAVRVNEDLADKAAQLAAQEAAVDPAVRAANLAMQQQTEAAAAADAALAGANARLADYFVAATNATNAVGFFNTTTTDAGAILVDTTVNQDSLNQAMYDAAVAAGASATELAVLGVATGVLSEEQAEAALKTAILQAGVAELAAAYVAGDLSISGLRTQMGLLMADVNNMDIDIGESTGAVDLYADSIGTAGTAALEAAGLIGGLAAAAEDAAGTYDITFNVTQVGDIPNPNGGYQGSSGAGNQQLYQTGGWTGSGPLDQIAGFVHRNEFVLPAPAVDALGLPFLEKLRQNALRGVNLTNAAAEQAAFNTQGIQPVTNNNRTAQYNLTVNAREERAQNIVVGNFRRMERMDRIRR